MEEDLRGEFSFFRLYILPPIEGRVRGGVLYMKYEEAIAKLEQIARQLEQNQLPIDQIAAQLREAQELVKYCREQLTSVDEEIKKIVGEETAE